MEHAKCYFLYKNSFKKVFVIAILLNCLQFANTITTSCKQHVFLAVATIDREKVKSLLNNDFTLPEHHPYSHLMSKNEYPVIFEFGEQIDCMFIFAFTKHTFVEFKLEIPFVIQAGNTDKNTRGIYKSFVYVNSYLDMLGSKLLYGLPTYKADMSITSNRYEFSNNEDKVSVSVEYVDIGNLPDSENFSNVNEFPNFTNYVNTLSDQWYCFNSLTGNAKCADMKYQWGSSKIRPVKLDVKIQGFILGKELSDLSFSTLDIKNYELGSSEVYVNIDIGLPHHC